MNARLKAALVVAVLVGLIGCEQQEPRRVEQIIRKEVKLQVEESYALLSLPKGRWLSLPGLVLITGKVAAGGRLGSMAVAERMISLDLDAPTRYAALNFRFISTDDEPADDEAVKLIFDGLGMRIGRTRSAVDHFLFSDGTNGWFLRIDHVQRKGPRASGLIGVVKRIDRGVVIATSLVSTRHESGRRQLMDALERAFRSISVRRDL